MKKNNVLNAKLCFKKNKTSLIKKDSEANSNNNSFENKEEPGQYQIQMKKEFNEGIERIPDRKKSMKNLNMNFKFRNNLTNTYNITVINEPKEKK